MSWVEEAKATAALVKAGQWTSYHIDQLADAVLRLVGERDASNVPEDVSNDPVGVAAPSATETYVEGADVPKDAE
jgi:ABC-type nitrate/sulfonate/bicarbonate transport system substrate-binding protein